MFKDPYLFGVLGTADPRKEHEVEASLVAYVERFLLELGAGFAFVGRRVPLEVGGDDFKLDLLFYHFKLRRFVVVELKSVKFDPGMFGRLHGFDALRADVVCLTRPTRSAIFYEQMIGRCLLGPLDGGTRRCLVIDVQDDGMPECVLRYARVL